MGRLEDGTVRPEMLLVEDNPADARLVDAALDALDREVNLHVVDDGYGAIQHLSRESAVDPPSRPDLVLLDLDLPGKDGEAVLDAIRRDPQLRTLPVLVLTGSDRDRDVTRSYGACANAFVTKPGTHEAFVDLMATIVAFWFGSAILPPVPR
ncbi:response regulator [Halovivax limisalsi]|uniref:response regulator n=1 Tax=Halovivax limisalsi TaxID=1453760 RepID=UPI001FFDAEF4|nr:response regulator [Halovivax limisalsi]